MRFIRWWGLMVFVLFVLTAGAVWFFLVDIIIERAIEAAGTRINGAKVDIKKADLSLMPLGLTLEGIEVTDREKPMTNLLQIARAALLIDSGNLMYGKKIIDEMTIDNIRLNTPRRRSGAIEKKKKDRGEAQKKSKSPLSFESRLKFPSLDIPSVDQILERESLDTLKKSDSVQNGLKKKREHWKERLGNLPDSEKIKEYKERAEAISKSFKEDRSNTLTALKAAAALRKEVTSDLDKIKEARKELREDVNDFKDDLKEIKRLSKEDSKRLEAKYSLSSAGLSNFSRLLFGDAIGRMTRRGIELYEKLKPFIEKAVKNGSAQSKRIKRERSKGSYVRFKESDPRPDFLIKEAGLTLNIPAGNIRGEIKNVTADQHIIGVPVTYTLQGENLRGIESVHLQGEVNNLDKEAIVNKLNLKLKGYELDDVQLMSGASEFPVAVKSALADIDIDIILTGWTFSSAINGRFRSVSIESNKKNDTGRFAEILSDALAGIKNFSIEGTVSGKPDDYHITVASDIDDYMKEAIDETVKAESERFEKKLRAKLEEKTNASIKDLRTEIGGLEKMEDVLTANAKGFDAALKDLLDGKLDSIKKRKGKEAETKIRDLMEEETGSKIKELLQRLK